MKVLWKETDSSEETIQTLNAAALFEGDLTLRKHEVELLTGALERGAEVIPEGSRTFQEWHVGLLERFTEEDVEPS